MKNYSIFAVHSILNGGRIRLLTVTGFFYVCTANIAARNPVWSVNAPTAVEVECNRTCGLFLFSRYNEQILSVMHSTEKKCLNGNNSTVQSALAHETSIITNYCKERLLKSVNDMFECHSIGRVANMLANLTFNSTHPDCSKHLHKDDIADMAADVISFLACLSDVYEMYHEFEIENQES